MSTLKWLDAYHKERKNKPGMGEIEWRFDCFCKYVVDKGFGYPSRLVRKEKNRTDIRIVSNEGISHIVIETKIADADLDKEATLRQAQSYLQGGESFLVLASPSRLKVFTPKGTFISNILLTESELKDNATFWQLSYDYLTQKKHLDAFRQGTLDYCYIPVHTRDGFDKFVNALRLCGDLLLRFLNTAFQEQNKIYREYEEKLSGLHGKRKSLESVPLSAEELDERMRALDQEMERLKVRYAVPIEIFEKAFPAFCQIQPYSRDVAEKELVRIYLADMTYAALNRLLFIRIAEDKGLLKRKISNGGIGVWRQFVTFLQDKYQDLVQLAYRDASHLYEHFFEYGIFDWYVKGDSQLNEALETILHLLNSFDLSKVDRDTLGDLYQEYLPPKQRKELGEFYTPREVVDYILRYVGWKGEGVLLDPACGSGGFLVRAANVLLQDMEKRGISEEARLKALPKVVGLDINPFATHIAEMNLLFLILDIYLMAKQQAEGKEFSLERLPVYTLDSLLGTAPGLQGGTTRNLFVPLAAVEELEEAVKVRDRVGEYDYLVMNPPYVRNERLPEAPRSRYRSLFQDVVSGNADIFTYFVKKDLDWLKDGSGRLGIIVSYGLAEAAANNKLRKFLAQYTIERVVPLEWCEVFAANVNPVLLFVKKAHPEPDHKVIFVHSTRTLKDLDEDKGELTHIPQEKWLALAPDGTWRLEVKEKDLPVLEKMKAFPSRLTGGYGLALRTISGGRTLVSDDPSELAKPYPLLDGREVKAWSIEWQGRFIDYQPKLISDPKTLEFFQAPKVALRRISLTSQAAVDEGTGASFLARNTVMVVRSPLKELNDYPYVMAALINSLPTRYYAFLMLRAGVVQKGYSTFYSGVIGNLPVPEGTFKDEGIRGKLDDLSHQAHRIAKEMVDGDNNLLKEVDSVISSDLVPFAHLPQSDLSGYFGDIDLPTAQVSEQGELRHEKLGVVKGHPAVLQYILSRALLEKKEKLPKADLESFPVPKDLNTCVLALERMDIWAQRKPTLSAKLREAEAEIDEIVLAAFTTLSEDERRYMIQRTKEFPLNQVLIRDEPGAPTKQLPVKYWKTGERYRV